MIVKLAKENALFKLSKMSKTFRTQLDKNSWNHRDDGLNLTFIRAEIHVIIISLRKLQGAQHRDVLFHNLVFFAFSGIFEIQVLNGSFQVPNVNQAMEGTFACHGPIWYHGQWVDQRIFALILFRLGLKKIDQNGSEKQNWNDTWKMFRAVPENTISIARRWTFVLKIVVRL